MSPTDTAIRKAKPAEKPYKLRDGGGPCPILRSGDGRWWRLDHRRPVTAKRNTLDLGTYPDVGLAAARSERDAARDHFATGIHPGEQRKTEAKRLSERKKMVQAWADHHDALRLAWKAVTGLEHNAA